MALVPIRPVLLAVSLVAVPVAGPMVPAVRVARVVPAGQVALVGAADVGTWPCSMFGASPIPCVWRPAPQN